MMDGLSNHQVKAVLLTFVRWRSWPRNAMSCRSVGEENSRVINGSHGVQYCPLFSHLADVWMYLDGSN